MTLFIKEYDMAKQYNELVFSDNDIKHKIYKNLIGSGRQWQERGKIQLDFMIKAGLKPYHVFIDIGCGPLRAGEYFIRYLNKSCYIGFDYAQGYIDVAKYIIENNDDLKAKQPSIYLCDQFNLFDECHHTLADFGIAYSVLNQCQKGYVQAFFKNMGKSFKSGAKIYAMNDSTKWYPKWLSDSDLQVTGTYNNLESFGINVRNTLGNVAAIMVERNDNFLIELTKQ